MFRFEHIEYFHFMWLILLTLLIFILYRIWRKKAISKLVGSSLESRLIPDFSRYKKYLKIGLMGLTIFFLSLAMVNPQWGSRLEKVKRSKMNVFFLFDISQSMYTRDVAPNRLELGRQLLLQSVRELREHRMGLIIFAGNAYLQMPLTDDFSSAYSFIKAANPEMAPTQGTAIGDAIELAMGSIPEGEEQGSVFIVLSDGEDHEGKALEMAQMAAEKGIHIFSLGVGTSQGGRIPYRSFGKADYKRDKQGKYVLSKLNPETLKDIARSGNGAYFQLVDLQATSTALIERVNRLNTGEQEVYKVKKYASYFQLFIGLGLLSWLGFVLISNKKSTLWARINPF